MITEKDGILTDQRNNIASISYFGSYERAKQALESCSGCSGCSDCSGCSRCSDCSDCSRCSGCSDCSRCSDCSDCSDCSRCSDCSDCSDCSRCSDCSSHKTEIKVPIILDIHKKVYEAVIKPEALNMETWHTCNTTHCRGGWVVTLAGKEGKLLEEKTSTLFAAQQIYKASGYLISPCRFFDSNEDALADMKKLAGA